MTTISELHQKPWWSYIEHDLQELLRQALFLHSNFGDKNTHTEPFHDYSFIVFPAAKAYEGFLKKFLLDMGFITKRDYSGKRFRIGRALNPSLKKYPDEESVFEKIERYCGGRELADLLWNTWKTCRNVLFHWFPDEENSIPFTESGKRIESVIYAIDSAFKECTMEDR